MKIHQLSLFLENSPGKAVEPCRLLARAGVNIRTLTLADTQQFGILRLIVKDWARAKKIPPELLETAGLVVRTEEQNDKDAGEQSLRAFVATTGLPKLAPRSDNARLQARRGATGPRAGVFCRARNRAGAS